MNILIVTPNRNEKKSDFKGAFLPEARAFAKQHGVPSTQHLQVDLDAALSVRRAALLNAIERGPKLDALALFTHGLPKKLPQLGWTTSNVAELAGVIGKNAAPNVRVVLYACSTAEGGPSGDGGIADVLRDGLCGAGLLDCQVDAHEGAAHTTMNPRLRRFEGRGSSIGGSGGYWLVTPGSPKWPAWRTKLKTPFRFDFPFMTAAEVMATL